MSHLLAPSSRTMPSMPSNSPASRTPARVLPEAAASFANSSGIFLGPDYHFDFARPGAALYGVAPVAGRPIR